MISSYHTPLICALNAPYVDSAVCAPCQPPRATPLMLPYTATQIITLRDVERQRYARTTMCRRAVARCRAVRFARRDKHARRRLQTMLDSKDARHRHLSYDIFTIAATLLFCRYFCLLPDAARLCCCCRQLLPRADIAMPVYDIDKMPMRYAFMPKRHICHGRATAYSPWLISVDAAIERYTFSLMVDYVAACCFYADAAFFFFAAAAAIISIAITQAQCLRIAACCHCYAYTILPPRRLRRRRFFVDYAARYA